MTVENSDGSPAATPPPAEQPATEPDIAMELLARLRTGGTGSGGTGSGGTGSGGAGSGRPGGGNAGSGHGGRRRHRRDQWSGPGPDPLDPTAVGAVFNAMITERGWQTTLAEARVVGDWGSLVGPDIAAHCAPVALRDGELRLAAQSTAWATQLRQLTGPLLAKIADQLGPDVVNRITVTGPVAPSWRHGRRTVHGARGPRDTYG